MEQLKSAYAEYLNYAAEKAKAEGTHKAELAVLRAKIAALQEDFKATWKERKEYLRKNLDHHATVALQDGHTPNSILLAIGSRNPTWIYHLKNSGAEVLPVDVESKHPLLKDVSWEYSDHVGTHGVLKSVGPEPLYKLYDLTDGETYCIIDSSLEFVSGSHSDYEARSRVELERITEMLTSLLDNTYQGAVRFKENKYTS